jgi:hypothetical protein
MDFRATVSAFVGGDNDIECGSCSRGFSKVQQLARQSGSGSPVARQAARTNRGRVKPNPAMGLADAFVEKNGLS